MDALRVVVVDDDPSTCDLLRAVFSAEGHECRPFLRADLASLDSDEFFDKWLDADAEDF